MHWSQNLKNKEHSLKCRNDVTWLYHFSYLVNKNLKGGTSQLALKTQDYWMVVELEQKERKGCN